MIAVCIISFVVGAMIMMCAIRLMSCQKDKKPRNKVHFYVTRDSKLSIAPDTLFLWMEKPNRFNEMWNDSYDFCIPLCAERNFVNFGLKPSDFKDLKFEDEPVEVFLNLED